MHGGGNDGLIRNIHPTNGNGASRLIGREMERRAMSEGKASEMSFCCHYNPISRCNLSERSNLTPRSVYARSSIQSQHGCDGLPLYWRR